MQEDISDVECLLFPVDPLARAFPHEWKVSLFRRRAKRDADGVFRYECPICKHKFDHLSLEYLHGDHIWPYSLCGETTRENFRVICGSCNSAKSNYIDSVIRSALGSGDFRRMVFDFLKTLENAGNPLMDHRLEDFIGARPEGSPKGQ